MSIYLSQSTQSSQRKIKKALCAQRALRDIILKFLMSVFLISAEKGASCKPGNSDQNNPEEGRHETK